jgi:hypothetical protein
LAVEQLEAQPEALVQLALPLFKHGGRSGDNDAAHLLPQQQLGGDQASFDRLAKPRVVGDEQIDARQLQRLAQGLHLVRVNLDTGSKRRLEQSSVGGRHRVPAHGVDEGGEVAGVVKALTAELLPTLALEDRAIELELPDRLELLALGVVLSTGQAHGRCVLVTADLFHEPAARAHEDHLADGGRAIGKQEGGGAHAIAGRVQQGPRYESAILCGLTVPTSQPVLCLRTGPKNGPRTGVSVESRLIAIPSTFRAATLSSILSTPRTVSRPGSWGDGLG